MAIGRNQLLVDGGGMMNGRARVGFGDVSRVDRAGRRADPSGRRRW
jgi:hypothetical protein